VVLVALADPPTLADVTNAHKYTERLKAKTGEFERPLPQGYLIDLNAQTSRE
jgi:hypothetical protein